MLPERLAATAALAAPYGVRVLTEIDSGAPITEHHVQVGEVGGQLQTDAVVVFVDLVGRVAAVGDHTAEHRQVGHCAARGQARAGVEHQMR